jgi:hypothetical protein
VDQTTRWENKSIPNKYAVSIEFSNLLLVVIIFFVHRPYWRCYFPNTQAIIYVVDSSDTDRLVIAREEFHAILEVHVPDRHFI